ncbi:penicillin acylase family protein [Alkalicoccus chagannorensis]|uniref:penicillin acylase family protein n=1 Tax=Alkalicoccus chagannorensis TaxID=427072 RepID=UPI00047BD299|nr:penicillin acylase family protein [Alkalicoccus chagannorensis]
MAKGPSFSPDNRPFWEKRWVKVLLWTLVGLLAAAIIAVLIAYWFLAQSLPDTEEGAVEAQVERDVEVSRTDDGVPRIAGDDLEEVFYTQGYVMAQDRLFQMDMTRRLAGGELAEVIGEDALESDEYFRTYGMHRAAGDMLDLFDEETESMVTAFAEGVTQYIEETSAAGELPLEFRILDYEPEPWTIEDTAVAVKYMGYTLTGNFTEELENYEIVRELGMEAEALFPDYDLDGDFPVIDEETTGSGEANESDAALQAYSGLASEDPPGYEDRLDLHAHAPPAWNGSNNWAVSGEHTASGAPLIADDPHLGLDIPAVWYQVELEVEGDFHSTGVTVPGIPGVVLGHNGSVSWGVTSLSADYEDVFLEQVNPENPNEYLYDDEWEEAERVIEDIYVEGEEEPREFVVDITRNGPVMNRVMEEGGPYQAYSMRWSGLEPGEELNGILALSRAEDADTFREGLEGFVTPGLSWVFADQDGNIGYQGQALIPIRQASDGRFPVPGWDPDFQWDGFVPQEDLPSAANPESGYIMTANHMPVGDQYSYEIGRSYHPYRGQRLETMIEEQLESGEPFTLETMAAMQQDVKNVQAEALLPLMTEGVRSWTEDMEARGADGEPVGSLSEVEEAALAEVENWDYEETAEASGALIWQLWYEGLPEHVYERHLEIPLTNHLTRHHTIEEGADDGMMFAFLDERFHVPFAQAMRESFYEAVHRAEEMQGDDPGDWEWGDWHQLSLSHPLGAVWPLNHVFDLGGQAVGGSGATPAAMSFDVETGEADHGAGWRFIGDLSDPDHFYDVLLPGQSGQRLSPHYADQIDTWLDGDYTRMPYQSEGEARFSDEQQ